MRLMDTKGDLWGTMTPLMGLTWVYEDIYMNSSKPIDKQDREIYCMFMEWDDNPYLSDEEKVRLEASMEPGELEARKRGRFVMPGKCVFDVAALQGMMEKCRPGERGNLSWVGDNMAKVEWIPDPEGEFEVWFHPDKDKEYMMAADVAEGLEHGDFDAVGVLNRDDFRLDAVYHGKVDPDILADYILRLAVYYNNPLVAPEANNHGLTTISHLKSDYQDIYRTTLYDKMADEEREKLGWYTNSKTRPLAVDAIKRSVREGHFSCYWRRFVDEAMSFVRHPNGKEAARSGYWDDAVMMMAILIHVHNTSAFVKSMPAPGTPTGGAKKAGWQRDEQGRDIFIHQSTIDDDARKEWGENAW